MTAKWVFEYFTAPSTWTAFTAKLKNTNEILNGHEEALLSISNDVTNRAFVASNQTVRVKYDGDVIYTGLLSALEYGTTILNCVLYNDTLEKLKTVTYTAAFPTGAGADTILAAVCALAGVTAGTCPTTSIAVRFDETSCYDVVMFLKDCLNSDVWTVGAVVNIGTRGSAKSVTNVKVKSRGLDRSKLRDKVRVKGMDASGNEIIGEAGSGTKVKVYREKKASDVTTLNTLAAKYLDELNTVSKGAPIEVPIDEAHDLYPGDTIDVTKARYNLSGSYKIMSISKYPSRALIQLDKPASSLEAKLLDFKKYEDIGIYQIVSGEDINPVTLSYQGLELLAPMDEGEGSFISDYGPYWRQGICYNHSWSATAAVTPLVLAGDGYATFGVDLDLTVNDTVTVAAWIDPSANGADVNYIAHKEGLFSLQHYTADDKIRFQVYVGGAWHELVTDANSSPVGSPKHIVARYDGANISIYIDNVLAKSAALTGIFGASYNTLYVGAKNATEGFFTGKLGMLFIFSRCVRVSEIADLYRFGKISVPPTTVGNSIDTQGIQAHYHMNEGQGSIANDSSSNDYPGTIAGATWTDGPTSRYLAFGGSAYILCGQQLDLGGVGRTKLALCGWTSLTAHYADKNYFFYKTGQYYLQHYGLTDQIRFGVYIGGAWRTITTESHIAPLSERLFVVGVYDGVNLHIYVNGTERARQAQTGALDSSQGVDLVMGAQSDVAGQGNLYGALTECMIWNRYLNRSEVVTLYFFPLTRLISVGGAGTSLLLRRTYGILKEVLNRALCVGCDIPNPTRVEVPLLGNALGNSKMFEEPNPIVEGFGFAYAKALNETAISKTDVPKFYTNGVLGHNGTSATSTTLINNIVGSVFTTPASAVTLTQGSAYVLCTTSNKNFKMAIYKHSDLTRVAQTAAKAITANAAAQRVFIDFPAGTTLAASTDYIVVAWMQTASGTGALYYAAGAANQGHVRALAYTTNFPDPLTVDSHNNNKYCLYVGYYY